MKTSFNVRIHAILTNKIQKGCTYSVRWKVDSVPFRQTFATKALAESFRSKLLIAQREGVAFDTDSGLPEPMARTLNRKSWLALAQEFADAKWPQSSPKHRASIAESLAMATPAFITSTHGAPPDREIRSALYRWAFNKHRRDTESPPVSVVNILRWLDANTADVRELESTVSARKALGRISLRLDGKAAAANTVARRRAVLYGALNFAVELRLLSAHPFNHITWTAPKVEELIDRRTVVNSQQASKLIEAVSKIAPDLEAFFGTLYYAALRPEEALHLHRQNYERPKEEGGWGWLQLTGATVAMGREWSQNDSYYQDRELKHRSKSATRRVPVAPELATLLDAHIAKYGIAETGRLFVTRSGSNPGRSIANSTYTRVWKKARDAALTKSQQESPLARVPYQLRHAAVSLWLNAGVPVPQVAEWAGHSPHVLLKVYAKCIDGEEETARHRIELALRAGRRRAGPTPAPTRIRHDE